MTTHLHDHLTRVHDHLHERLRHSRLAMFGLNRRPAAYEAAFGCLGDPLYQRVAADAAASGLTAGALVVDIGTGPGRVPEYLHRLRPDLKVEGVDVSPEMIQRARARTGAGQDAASGLGYTVADVAHLPHADGSVDLVVSSLSLHHWPDPAAGLAEVRRVLGPSGRAWIYDVAPQLRGPAEQLRAAGVPARIAPLSPQPNTRGRIRDHLYTRWIARLEIG